MDAELEDLRLQMLVCVMNTSHKCHIALNMAFEFALDLNSVQTGCKI